MVDVKLNIPPPKYNHHNCIIIFSLKETNIKPIAARKCEVFYLPEIARPPPLKNITIQNST